MPLSDVTMIVSYDVYIWVNIGSGNGLLPDHDGTKPSPEPILTNHQWGLVVFSWWQFYKKFSKFDMSLKVTYSRLQPHLPGINELKNAICYSHRISFLQNSYSGCTETDILSRWWNFRHKFHHWLVKNMTSCVAIDDNLINRVTFSFCTPLFNQDKMSVIFWVQGVQHLIYVLAIVCCLLCSAILMV